MSNLLQKASIITTPTAYDTGKILSVKPVETYGPELITNGDFATDSDWTKETGWSIGAGVANCDGTQTANSNFYQPFAWQYKKYKHTITVSMSSGRLLIYGGNTSPSISITSSGTYVFYANIILSGNVNDIYIQANSSFIGSIDNVSVKEVFNADFDFERNSSATRVGSNGLIQDVASNLPRIDYTGGVGSWKFEPQSINVLPYSENFSHSSWSKNDLTIQSGYIAPDGTNSAYKVTKIGSNAHLVNTITGGNTATKSIFAKTTSGTGTIILFNNVTTYFTITEEWQRFDIQHNGSDFFYAADFRGVSTLTEIIIWGAQSEALSYPTSYIRSNSGSATTRLADVANNAGSSDLINSTEGVLYAEISALANDGSGRKVTLNNGSNSQVLVLEYTSTSNQIRVFLSNGSLQFNEYITISDLTEFNKIAIKYKVNDFAIWVNGIELATDTSGTTFSSGTLTNVNFDDGSGNSDFYGNTKSVAVFKEALTDLELECLVSWMSFSDLGINFGYTVE
jgi:hypothetical protein